MPFISIEEATRKSYDFVVIGGGTAGLVAAVRLSEDPSVTVLVLEAGRDNLNDPRINIPGQFGATLGDPEYDWGFSTSKQENINDREMIWSRGKGLGGTSAMNFYAWIKPPAENINDFEKLGNPGWNWNDFMEHSKRTETFHPPKTEDIKSNDHRILEHRGASGPVQVTLSANFKTLDNLFLQTCVNMGLNAVQDPYGGNINGAWIADANLNPKDWTRSSSATAYLFPNIERENLSVLTHAMVSRVILEAKHGDEDRRVSDVEFVYNSTTHVVKVGKEVILSAGSINSPHILELSGIGQSALISGLGIKPEIDLPGVGENVQEHIFATLVCELNPSTPHETLDLLLDPEYAAKAKDLHSIGQGMYCSTLTSFAFFPFHLIDNDEAVDIIDRLENEVDAEEKQGLLSPGRLEQLRLQISTLRDENIPDCEVILWPGAFPGKTTPEIGKSYISLGSFVNRPLSRGSIHSRSADPGDQPKIDPQYFERDADLNILVQHFKFTRRMLQTEPLKSDVLHEILPGPDCQTDDQIKDFLKKDLSSTWHTAGSCSMLPRHKNGVVNPQLKVYGTQNLRVADISIMPLHINAHPQTTAYVIGEKVATFIKTGLDQ